MEKWKTIPNFSRYQASNYGNLRSTNYKNSQKTKVLKPAIAKDGYYQTMLQNDSKKYCSWKVHKFIAITFLGEKKQGLEVNHKDGNKLNNSVDNLEWVTRSENMLHCFRLGLEKPLRGDSNGNSKLTVKDVQEIRCYVENFNGRYYGRKELAIKYNVSEAHIKTIVNKRTWTHI